LLLIRGILAALRQTIHLTTCPNSPGHLSHLRLDAPEPPLNCCSAATRCEKLGAVIDEIDRQRVTRSTDLPDAA